MCSATDLWDFILPFSLKLEANKTWACKIVLAAWFPVLTICFKVAISYFDSWTTDFVFGIMKTSLK